MAYEVVVEHLNHLGIVAEVCREIGVAEWLDAQDPTSRQRVSVGTATVAMVLNGLGFSNRQLYLVSQFFADKPVEHLLGPGLSAADLNDDCLGRTLDWLYTHDVTTLFAGLGLRARRAFGVPVTRLHADTTSFAVSGQYTPAEGDLDAQTIAVTYGYSRDHREDLKQWMLALVTSDEGIPHFLKPLDGNASDKTSLPEVVLELARQLRASGETPGVYVADSGLYSETNMRALNEAEVQWVSRVPETVGLAQAMVREDPLAGWQHSADNQLSWWGRTLALPQGQERWLVVRSREGEQRARTTLARHAARERAKCEKRWWHLSHRSFACAADAHAAREQERRQLPSWLRAQATVGVVPKYGRRGRPRRNAPPVDQEWHVQAELQLDAEALEQEARRKAAFLVATNVLEEAPLPDLALIQTYKAQSAVERGFAFLKDPLFLASSVFVKKPARLMALAFIMVLCLLVYRLAERRVRQRLAATQETVPDQLRRPTSRPTMRWLFQCFEGIDLHHLT
ncbi:MAG TPA: IS1634 family transposase [Ktedonobacterales bacterium]